MFDNLTVIITAEIFQLQKAANMKRKMDPGKLHGSRSYLESLIRSPMSEDQVQSFGKNVPLGMAEHQQNWRRLT